MCYWKSAFLHRRFLFRHMIQKKANIPNSTFTVIQPALHERLVADCPVRAQGPPVFHATYCMVSSILFPARLPTEVRDGQTWSNTVQAHAHVFCPVLVNQSILNRNA